tara:strand:+ start:33 stop:509 length:477 start_codon:yes stop_codon:yes gene_type:complete
VAIDLKNLNDEDLIQIYPDLINELKKRDIIRTNNIVGELGEYFAVKIFNETTNLPKLQMAPPNTENVDALSTKGKRYAIKSTSSNNTGVFASIAIDQQEPSFEYLLILRWDNYQVKSLLQFSWEQFVQYRKVKRPENKYHFSLNNQIINEADIIYEAE